LQSCKTTTDDDYFISNFHKILAKLLNLFSKNFTFAKLMSKTNPKATKRKKIHKTRRKNYLFRRYFVGYFRINLARNWALPQNKVAFYYAMYFEKLYIKIKKFEEETARINKIVTEYNDKILVSIFLIISTNET
jgi:lysozyme